MTKSTLITQHYNDILEITEEMLHHFEVSDLADYHFKITSEPFDLITNPFYSFDQSQPTISLNVFDSNLKYITEICISDTVDIQNPLPVDNQNLNQILEQASQLLQHWYQNDYGYLMQVNNRYHQFRLANFQSLAALCTTTLENIASHDQIGKFQMAMLDKTYPVLRGYRFNQEQQLEAMFEIDEYGNFIELNPDYTHWAADEIGIYIYLNLCCQQRQMGSENDRTTIFS